LDVFAGLEDPSNQSEEKIKEIMGKTYEMNFTFHNEMGKSFKN